MNRSTTTRLTLTLLALAIGGSAAAQQPQTDFPNERERPRTCEDFGWHADMTREHPRVVEACQESVFAGGEHWARLNARFIRTLSNNQVEFSIRDKRDRIIEEVVLQMVPGQVAYIDERETPFSSLRADQSVNLYVPEGRYGYATQAGAPRQYIATRAPRPAAEPVRTDLAAVEPRPAASSYQDDRPARLPMTAGSTPWLALTGLLSLLAGLGLTLNRKL